MATIGQKRPTLKKDARMILQLDFYGIDHLPSAFGGMGSLNDVVLQRYDGNTAIVPSVENEQFSALRQDIYSLASKLKSEEFQKPQTAGMPTSLRLAQYLSMSCLHGTSSCPLHFSYIDV
ncbi:DUF6966 domain-containing protein [Herbaspirillum robiniae]|uniref:DUF6966 domain-containing protein n=1 Tax=Herbaspirillum robiniae TaxID=2014887 RepID=UPI003D789ED0